MNIKELNENLKESLEVFSIEGHNHVAHNTGESLNEYDYDELCRQFFYVMDDFRQNIIKYLESQEK